MDIHWGRAGVMVSFREFFPLNLVVFFNILGFNISDASMLGVGLTHNLPKQAHDLYVNY